MFDFNILHFWIPCLFGEIANSIYCQSGKNVGECSLWKTKKILQLVFISQSLICILI